MPSLNEVVYDVYNVIRGGHGENTNLPSLRQVKRWVLNYRSMLIRQAVQRGDIPNHFEQEMDNVPFKVVEYPDGGRFGMDPLDAKMLLRSIIQIPEPVRLKSGLPAFTFIGLPSLVTNYELVDYHEAAWKNTYSKYTGNKPKATWFNNQVLITNFSPEQVSGGFTEPGEVVMTIRVQPSLRQGGAIPTIVTSFQCRQI